MDYALRVRSLLGCSPRLRGRLRGAHQTPWARTLRKWWERWGDQQILDLVYAYLTPTMFHLGLTRDAELLVWTGPGWQPPRHVGTYRLFRIGSGALPGEEGGDDTLHCATLWGSRLVAATKHGRIASFPLEDEEGEVHWYHERLGICDLANDGTRTYACLGDGSILSMDAHLQYQHKSLRCPIPVTARWCIAIGTGIYAVAPETMQVLYWPKSLKAIANWNVSNVAGPRRVTKGAHQICCTSTCGKDLDRIYLTLADEIQVWEVNAGVGSRELVLRLHSHARPMGVWETEGARLITIRRGTPPGTAGEKFLVDLTAGVWEELEGWQEHIIFDEDVICAALGDQLVSLTKQLDGPSGGLTLHTAGLSHSMWSGVEGGPGEAVRLWTIPLKGWRDAQSLEGEPRDD